MRLPSIRAACVLWCLVALLLLTYIATLRVNRDLGIETNILRLLPGPENFPGLEQAFDAYTQATLRDLVLLVGNSSLQAAKQDASGLASRLSANQRVERVRLRVSPEEQFALGEYGFTHRHHLLSAQDRRLLEAGEYQRFADDALSQIFSPLSGGLVRLLPDDPFLLSYRFARQAGQNDFDQVDLDDGYLVSEFEGASYVLLTVQLAASPFDSEVQEALLADIQAQESRWAEEGTGSELLRTGALFYAADAYREARWEISTFGGASLLLVISLIVLVFRRLTQLLLVVTAIGFGIASGFSAVRLLFGEVHLLTLVFGASLIGVAVDYAFHYLTAGEEESASSRLRGVFSAISLGLVSSAIGYSALLTTPFPGLQQMALFCITGLVGAYLTVIALFPVVRVGGSLSQPLLRLCSAYLRLGASSVAIPLWRAALILPLPAVLFTLLIEDANDDIRQFQPRSVVLESQEAKIQAVLDAPAANQFYLVRGDSAQGLIEALERTEVALDAQRQAGVIRDYVSLTGWLPSIARQQDNYRLYRALYDSSAARAFVDAGVLSEAEFARARQTLAGDDGAYARPASWQESAVGESYAHLWLGEIDGRFYAIVPLRGIVELARLDDIGEDAIFVDQIATINDLLGSYRYTASLLLLVATALIFLLLAMRLGLRRSAIVVSSPLIAVSTTIVLLGLMGQSMNLFSVLAMFLVIGIGMDYGIFFAERGRPSPYTQLAILLSALTTGFSFGMLAMSSTLAIHSFGIAMLIGIVTVLLLSPVIARMLTAREKGI